MPRVTIYDPRGKLEAEGEAEPGESLLQVAGLRRAHPAASRSAERAAEAVLREPVR